LPLGFVALFKVLVDGREAGLLCVGKLSDDAHEPVLQIYKKQNRELSYTSERRGKPAMSWKFV